jgi:hypothetical protein
MAAETQNQTWFEKNQKKIMIGAIIVVIALLVIPDAYIRKIPWVG